MPLTRYQIRNEYSLADPELYRAADRDDPEALLEGVAMAGLVGVLRQLGDLAEFAAEIFHDLHEELMATSARGHGLMLRVQQLEAEFPPIEKAFLSRTNHSLFIHNAGADWHPNLRLDQNVITQGDLPRFVMDSYEECRGPPRLFLLDKFDIGGAGACLKRYSDPSFFRAEFTSSKAKKEESKREKRSRKIKKKVPRWKNVETPDLTTSHFKLHQLFSEEEAKSENVVQTHHVKLKKRQSNRSLPYATTEKSYMERFLHSPPDTKSVYGSYASQRLKIESSNSRELVPDIHEIRSRSPSKELLARDITPVLSLSTGGKVLDPSMNEFSKDVFEEGNLKSSLELITAGNELDTIPSVLDKMEDKKQLVVYGEGKVKADLDGYRSEDVTSEVENYVDALATMDSEMDTDTESKPKKGHGFKIEKQWVVSDTDVEQKMLQTHFTDSQSIGSFVASDDGNNSFKKGRSSLSYSDSSSNSRDDVPLDRDATKQLHAYTPAEFSDLSDKMASDVGNTNGSRYAEYAVLNGTCNDASVNPSYMSRFGELSYKTEVTDLTATLRDLSPQNEGQFSECNLVDTSSAQNYSVAGESLHITQADSANTVERLPCLTDVSNIPSQSRDNSLSVRSRVRPPLEKVDGRSPDVSYGAVKNIPIALDPSGKEEEIDEKVFDAMLPSGDGDDNHTESLVKGKIEDGKYFSSNGRSSEIIFSDGELDDVRRDSLVAETSKSIQSREKSEDFRNADDSGEQKLPEQMDSGPVLEQDFHEVGTSSGLEIKWNNLESKDESAPNIDVSPDSPTGCTISDATESVSVANPQLEVAGSETTNACPVDHGEFAGNHIPSDSSFCDQLELQGCCSNAGFYKDDLEFSELSRMNHLVGLDADDKEENQPAVATLDDNIDLVEHLKNNLQHDEDSDLPLSLKEHDQEIEEDVTLSHLSVDDTVASSAHLLELGVPHQGSELQSENIDMQSKEVGGNSNSLHYNEHTGSLNQTDCDGCSDLPPFSSPLDPLSQSSDLNLSTSLGHKLENADPTVTPSKPVSQGSGLHHEGADEVPWDQQPYTPSLDASLPDQKVLPASVEETPPLPPLPPMQWRIGKPRHGFANSEEETVQHSFFPSFPLPALAASEKPQQDIPPFSEEIAQQTNPFMVDFTPGDEKIQQDFHILGTETFQPCLNPLYSLEPVSDDQIQNSCTSNTTVTPSQNLFLSLADEDPQHDSSNSGEEVFRTSSSNLVAPAPSDDKNAQDTSSTPQEESELPMDLLARVLQKEDEKLHQTALASLRETMQPLNPPEEPKLANETLENGSQTIGRELEWYSSSSAAIPTVEEMNLNGTLKSRLARPRDPLIEAVASHDKSNLRKVTERVLPQAEPKVDERNSMLEQIRTKSFNLKPAALTRPSIQGPRTNLKVVAILEKANAIRQALAGSDDEDDDEDTWSDS